MTQVNFELPYNEEAEEAVISSVLIEPELFKDLRPLINADDFRGVVHKSIWESFVHLDNAGSAIDYITVSNYLKKEKKASPAEITKLISPNVLSGNCEHYARIVKDFSKRRNLIVTARDLAVRAYGKEPLNGNVHAVIDKMNRIMDSGVSETLTTTFRNASQLWDQVQSPSDETNTLLKSGIIPLDLSTGGIDVGSLWIIMARPMMGKTSLMLQIADEVSAAGGVVAFFSKEMTSKQCIMRMACRRAHVPVQKVRKNELTDEERSRLLNWLVNIGDRETLFIDEKKQQTTAEVITLCRKLKRDKGKLDLVMCDHLRLHSDENSSEVKRMGLISWAYKIIAGELETRSMCAAQLNRAAENRDKRDRKPKLSDLRDSGEIEENADVVVGLYREAYYSKNFKDKTVELGIEKNRDGSLDNIEMVFQDEFMSFERVAYPH